MITTGSSSKKSRVFSLYLTTLKSLAPAMIILGIILFMIIILPFIYSWITGNVWYYSSGTRLYYYNDTGIFLDGEDVQNAFVYITVGIMAYVLALSTNSYMHQKKNVDLYHSIPVRREQLLRSNALASLTAITIPLLLNYALAIFLQLFAYAGRAIISPGYHWYNFHSFFCGILYAAAIYLFVAFISVNVGTVFDSFAISAALGSSLTLVYLVSRGVWANISYGASFNPESYVLLLSPFTFIFYRLELLDMDRYQAGYLLLFMLCALIITAALYFLAAVCYKRRQSELAEQPQSGGVFQSIVKIVACFAGASFLYLIFNESGMAGGVISAFLGAVLFGIIAELILSRGARYITKNLKLIVGTGALCGILIIVVSLDLTGYVSRVPAPESVEKVSISYQGRFENLGSGSWYYYDRNTENALTSPESIEVVTSAHRLAVDRWKESGGNGQNVNYGGPTIEYKLKNGITMKRSYNSIDRDAMGLLINLEDKDDFIATRSPLFYLQNERVIIESVSVSDAFESRYTKLRASEQDIQTLLNAIRTDMQNETLGGIMYPQSPAIGYIVIVIRPDMENLASYYRDMLIDTCVIITPEYTNTIAALQYMGAYGYMENDIQPDSVYLSPATYYGNYRRVSVISDYGYNPRHYGANSVYSYWETAKTSDSMYSYELIASTSDAAEVAMIFDRSSVQMVSDPEPGYYYDAEAAEIRDDTVYCVTFTQGGSVIGSRLIHYSDLPPAMREAAREFSKYRYEENDKHMNAAIPETFSRAEATGITGK